MNTRNQAKTVSTIAFAIALLGSLALLPSAASAVPIAQTDFTGRTVSGDTANSVSWTTLGLLDPGSLTAIDELLGFGSLAGLFDSANAQGHFAPNKNIGNEGPWSVDVPLVVEGGKVVTLDSVDLDWQHFNNSGVFQTENFSVDWTVEVTGSSSGVLDTVTSTVPTGNSGIETLTFVPSLSLTDAESYTLNILASATTFPSSGNNTGLDGLTLNGSVADAPVPEPSTFALATLGLLGLTRMRRRKR